MMLHRHFEADRRKKEKENKGEFVSEIFTSTVEADKREHPKRGRPRKTED